MCNINVSPTVTNCGFYDNSAMEFSGQGGGMYNENASPTVTNCVFIHNVASDGGAMTNTENSSPAVMHCTFSWNSSHGYGGGLDNGNASAPTFTNCVLFKNSSYMGGGAYNSGASATFINCTLVENSARDSGGAMFIVEASSLILTNCIVWANESPFEAELYNPPYSPRSSLVVSYSCVAGGIEGTGNIASDPGFLSEEMLCLQGDSPCIDSAIADGAPSSDIWGVARPNGEGVDMGAFEYIRGHPPTVTVTVTPLRSH